MIVKVRRTIPQTLWWYCDLSLYSLSFSHGLQISCILIPLPEAVFSRQPIKTLLSVGVSTSCILRVLYSIHPHLPQKSQIYSHTTHSLCVLSSTALIYLLLHSSQHLWDCYLTPLCFLSTFPNFVLVLLFYLSDLIQSCSLKVQASYEVSYLFQKGDSCWKRNGITTCCYHIWMSVQKKC